MARQKTTEKIPDKPQLISLRDYINREDRLRNRHEMRGAFIRYCQRTNNERNTLDGFQKLLEAFERGVRT